MVECGASVVFTASCMTFRKAHTKFWTFSPFFPLNLFLLIGQDLRISFSVFMVFIPCRSSLVNSLSNTSHSFHLSHVPRPKIRLARYPCHHLRFYHLIQVRAVEEMHQRCLLDYLSSKGGAPAQSPRHRSRSRD